MSWSAKISVEVPGRDVLATCSVPELRECLAASRRARAVLDAISHGLRIAGESRESFLGLVAKLVEVGSEMSVPDFADAVTRAAKSVVADEGLSVFEDQKRSTYLRVWNDISGMVNIRGAFDPEIGTRHLDARPPNNLRATT